jgi:hypothetical protein
MMVVDLGLFQVNADAEQWVRSMNDELLSRLILPTILVLLACTVEAATRDEDIRLAREAIAQTAILSEIVQIDVPQEPRAMAQPRRVPGEWFGEAKADTTWDGPLR